MRSIGKRYIALTKDITRQLLKHDPNIREDDIIQYLPVEMWETWESADDEIRRIINDEIFKIVYSPRTL